MKIKYATICECGKRANNEDAFKVMDFADEGRWMGIVCDGLGGHPMGEVASESVVESVSQYYEQHREGEAVDLIDKACRFASEKLNERADSLHHVDMGTTLVMAIIANGQISIAHVGDSRCYLVKSDGDVVYQTIDHTKLSFGWEVLSKCFFAYKENIAVPEIAQCNVQPGDRILICSDGLYKSVAPEILIARMADDKSPEAILDTFAFLCEKNGNDNYTGIFAIIE